MPDFSKPIKFRGARFLDGFVLEQVDRCPHCNRVGHVKDKCFDLHPCEHCGKNEITTQTDVPKRRLLQERN